MTPENRILLKKIFSEISNNYLDDVATENAELKEENRKLNFELNEYKAIVSELRIYEICWKKFKPVADVTISRGREPLDELVRNSKIQKQKLGSK